MILHRFLEALKTVIRLVESLNLSVSTIDNQNVLSRLVVLEKSISNLGFDDVVDFLC